MITTSEMKKLEDLSEKKGITKLQLMENAGRGMFEEMSFLTIKDKKILVVCGNGNNGGDGFVLTRYLKQNKYDVKVLFLGEQTKLKKESSYNYLRLKDMFPELFVTEFIEADVYVDAILGTGVQGKIREPFSSIITKINDANKYVISVDIPTGLNPDTGEIIDKCIRANLIYTFHDIKPGLIKVKDKVKIINIGIKEDL